MHRFIGKFDLAQSGLVVDEPDFVHQVRDVLKLEIGEHVILCDGTGYEAEAQIISLDRRAIGLELKEKRKNHNEPKQHVVLYCALLKRENFEWVVQKATETGVAVIVPLVTLRTVKLGAKIERWQQIAKEAAEQSGRGIIPLVQEPIVLEKALKNAAKNELNFLFDSTSSDLLVTRFPLRVTQVGLFIGPEGGWSENELEMAKKYGLFLVSLGNLTLRSETAAVIATYLATQAGY